ncbi:hypothetical protein [Streptomyces oceani]|uniref:Uncharacterized protein n=1 Tax=Streptomyces oceani TaxID=1075402 RepID=A0A1E7JXE8_9ACTN|nr:hypothetical protein [Streptomyces oceani]OEU96337.1 hypothetical protein AN216_20975 [Streptomyces oceani]
MELPDEQQMITEATAQRAGAASGTRGAASGARRGMRFTKLDAREFDLTSGLEPSAALALAQRVLEQAGGAAHATAGTSGTAGATDEAVALRGLFGVGMGGLNPAAVTFTVRPHAGGPGAPESAGSAVHVRTAALEGLIKQRGARKAADRVTELWTANDPGARLDPGH